MRVIDQEDLTLGYKPPVFSGWICYLLGNKSDEGLIYTPLMGEVPNIFERLIMRFFFKSTWRKIK